MNEATQSSLTEVRARLVSWAECEPAAMVSGEIVGIGRGSDFVTLFDGSASCSVLIPSELRPRDGLRAGVVLKVGMHRQVNWRRTDWYWRATEVTVTAAPGPVAQRRSDVRARLISSGVLDRRRRVGYHGFPRRDGKPPWARLIVVAPRGGGHGWRDISHELKNAPEDRLVLSEVEGSHSMAEQAIRALQEIGREDADAVLIARGGGGDAEFLQFDDEALARAIIACPVPVVVAVGHADNITIADEVAYGSFSTPSNAARAVAFETGWGAGPSRVKVEEERRERAAQVRDLRAVVSANEDQVARLTQQLQLSRRQVSTAQDECAALFRQLGQSASLAAASRQHRHRVTALAMIGVMSAVILATYLCLPTPSWLVWLWCASVLMMGVGLAVVSGGSRRPRPRSHVLAISGVAGLTLMAGAALGVMFVEDAADDVQASDSPGKVTRTYLDAMDRGDVMTMRGLVSDGTPTPSRLEVLTGGTRGPGRTSIGKTRSVVFPEWQHAKLVEVVPTSSGATQGDKERMSWAFIVVRRAPYEPWRVAAYGPRR